MSEELRRVPKPNPTFEHPPRPDVQWDTLAGGISANLKTDPLTHSCDLNVTGSRTFGQESHHLQAVFDERCWQEWHRKDR